MNCFEESVEKSDMEEGNHNASKRAETDSFDSLTVDLIQGEEGRRDADGHVMNYSCAINSFFSTFGLMSVVLMIALDNYIIGTALLYSLSLADRMEQSTPCPGLQPNSMILAWSGGTEAHIS